MTNPTYIITYHFMSRMFTVNREAGTLQKFVNIIWEVISPCIRVNLKRVSSGLILVLTVTTNRSLYAKRTYPMEILRNKVET